MGKKKAPKVVAPQVPEPPFSFHVDNFSADSGECALHLYEAIDIRFKEVEVEVRVMRNPITGRAEYDLKVVKLKGVPRPPGVYMPEELLPFPVINMATGETLIAEPERTGGRQPFVLIHPETKVVTSYEAPYFLHYEQSNRKRYLLDLRNFVGGKLKFKDPETKEDILVDITGRVDPLSGEPLYGPYENPERTFLKALDDGEAYVVQDPVTGEIQVLGITGELLLGYRTLYDPDTNSTSVVDGYGEVRAVLEGRYEFPGDRGSEDELELAEITFDASEDSVGLDGERVHDKRIRDNDAMRDVLREALDIEDQDLPQIPGDYHVVTDPVTGMKRFVDQNDQPVSTDKYRLEVDPLSGTIRLVSLNGDPVDLDTLTEEDVAEILGQLPDGYHLSQDLDEKQLELVLPSGHILQFDLLTGQPLPMANLRQILYSQETSQIEELPPDKHRKIGALLQLGKLLAVDEPRPNLKLENYFAELKLEEGRTILDEARSMTYEDAKTLLTSLIRIIEFENDFINAAMSSKLREERDYMEGFLREKQVRLRLFIADMLQKQSNAYDRIDLIPEVLNKLARENEYIMDRLDSKLLAENQLLGEAMARELRAHKGDIVTKSNRTCYKAVKRLLYKQLSLRLEAEVLVVREELCRRFKQEREELVQEILRSEDPRQEEGEE